MIWRVRRISKGDPCFLKRSNLCFKLALRRKNTQVTGKVLSCTPSHGSHLRTQTAEAEAGRAEKSLPGGSLASETRAKGLDESSAS